MFFFLFGVILCYFFNTMGITEVDGKITLENVSGLRMSCFFDL